VFDQTRLEALVRALDGAGAAGSADAALSRAERRGKGAYFTPPALVDVVVEATLEPLVAGRARGIVPELVVVDPACGDGRFLASAQRFLSRRLGLEGARADELARRCLVGIERDPVFAELAAAAVPGARVHCAEALTGTVTLDGADAVIGNPPYLRSIHLGLADAELRASLRGRFSATSHGEWDLYAAFLEQAFEWIRDRGQAGLVVPSRWLTAQYAVGLRGKLAASRALRGVIDFGAEQVFDDATTYASVTFLSGTPVEAAAVARLRRGTWAVGSLATSTLSSAPWSLCVGTAARTMRALEGGRRRLSEVASIVKGAGTNCDPVFVFAGQLGDGAVSRVRAKSDDGPIEIETAALRRCYRGRDVGSPLEPGHGVLALVPYHPDGGLWPPHVLAERFPLARTHLHRCRPRLEARERGRFAGETFYCYGRPQNMEKLLSGRPRVLVPDVAKGGRAIADRDGCFALDSAYAVFPEQDAWVDALAAVLASSTVLWWLGERGVLLRGGYVRMKTAFLRDLPIPDLDRLGAAVERDPRAWDQLVAEAYGWTGPLGAQGRSGSESSSLSAMSSGRS